MGKEELTALQTQFTTAITDMKAPILAIMGAGVAITLIFVAYKAMKGSFKKSTT